MRLRTRIQAPERFEDEDYNKVTANIVTKPAFPRLLREQSVAFDPQLRPAAFPSLPQAHPRGDGDRRLDEYPDRADVDMLDTDRSSDNILPPILRRGEHLSTQIACTNASSGQEDACVEGTSFLQDLETSDEEEQEVSRRSASPIQARDSNHALFLQTQQDYVDGRCLDGTQRIRWTQLAHSLQVEIFENLCSVSYGQLARDVLGLDCNEVYEVREHVWARNKQIVAEDQGIKDLQDTQLRAILRKDHSSSLSSDSWRAHVAYTRRHLPHISSRPDYFICSKADWDLGRMFLSERGIDTRVLGRWSLNTMNRSTINRAQTQVLLQSESGDGNDSGYNSEISTLRIDHAAKRMDRPAQLNVLLETSTQPRQCSTDPSFQHEKRSQSMLDSRLSRVDFPRSGSGPPAAFTTSSEPKGWQIAGSPSGLWARGSHQTPKFRNATAVMTNTSAGGSEHSDAPYEGDHEHRPTPNPPHLMINSPKSSEDKEDQDLGNVVVSPGQRLIRLKISGERLEKVRAVGCSNGMPSNIRSHRNLTPPAMTRTREPISDPAWHSRSRSQQPMPVPRHLLTEQDKENSNAFSQRLLEIQRGARLSAPLSSLTFASQQSQSQSSTSPKRPKLDMPQDTTRNPLTDDPSVQPISGSSGLQRKDSGCSQEAPPWSPITQISNSSRPSSRKQLYKDHCWLYKVCPADISNPLPHPTLIHETESVVSTTPWTPPCAKPSYRGLSITAAGSPVFGPTLDVGDLSKIPLEDQTYQQARPELRPGRIQGVSQLLEHRRTLWWVPSNVPILSPGPGFCAPACTDPLFTHDTGILQHQPISLQSSLSGTLAENLVSGVSTKPPLGTKLELEEQTSVITAAPAKRPAEEDRLLTEGLALLGEKVSETPGAATTELQESSQTKPGKDGKVRPRTYVKSQKQMQKEAANAAAKAALGKVGLGGKRGITEGLKTGGKPGMALQTPVCEPPTLQLEVHVDAALTKGKRLSQTEPSTSAQVAACAEEYDGMKESLAVKETRVEQPLVVTPWNQNLPRILDWQAAPKVTDNECYRQGGTFDAPTVEFRKIATPRARNVPVSRVNAALPGYQTETGTSKMAASPNMTLARDHPVNGKAVDGQDHSALHRSAASKLDSVGAEAEGVHRQKAPFSNRKVTQENDVPSGDGEQAGSMNQRTKKSNGLTQASSAVRADDEGKTKAFRGNQYLNADRTPRVKKGSGMLPA